METIIFINSSASEYKYILLFSLSRSFNNWSKLRDLRRGDEENVQVNLCLLSLPQYKKPKEILTLEQELLKELKKLKGTCEGDVDCKTQWILTVGGRGNHLCCISSRSEPRRFPVSAGDPPLDAFISEMPRLPTVVCVVIIFALFVWFKHYK